jgi:hypothetical protein
MTNDRKGGVAFIAGSIGFIITMAIHPLPLASATIEKVHRMAIISGIAHAFGIASTVLLFLGACALAQRLRGETCSFAALVTFGFSCVAIFIAATISGFVIPPILKHMARDEAANAHQWEIVMWGIFQLNQAFARIYAVGASVAIILWSTAARHSGGLSQGIVIYGYIIAALVILGVGSGHVQLDVHGMAAVGLTQIIWFVLVGWQMYSRPRELAE